MEHKRRTTAKILILAPLIVSILIVLGFRFLPLYISNSSMLPQTLDSCIVIVLFTGIISVIIGTVMAIKRKMKLFIFLGVFIFILLLITGFFFLHLYLITYFTWFRTVY